MSRRYPTYHLGPDFRRKLARCRGLTPEQALGEFETEFARLDDFICRAWEEDSPEKEMRRTPKGEYLRELLAFSLYDEQNREKFNRTGDTLIILPDCLSLGNPNCERTESKYGDTCVQCDKSCQSYWVTELAKTYSAHVAYSKRKLGDQLKHYARKLDNVGIIGIACILMLADGMRTAAELNLPTRGVLLSYTGCEHWNDEPFASHFPIGWLKEILEEKYRG